MRARHPHKSKKRGCFNGQRLALASRQGALLYISSSTKSIYNPYIVEQNRFLFSSHSPRFCAGKVNYIWRGNSIARFDTGAKIRDVHVGLYIIRKYIGRTNCLCKCARKDIGPPAPLWNRCGTISSARRSPHLIAGYYVNPHHDFPRSYIYRLVSPLLRCVYSIYARLRIHQHIRALSTSTTSQECDVV